MNSSGSNSNLCVFERIIYRYCYNPLYKPRGMLLLQRRLVEESGVTELSRSQAI